MVPVSCQELGRVLTPVALEGCVQVDAEGAGAMGGGADPTVERPREFIASLEVCRSFGGAGDVAVGKDVPVVRHQDLGGPIAA